MIIAIRRGFKKNAVNVLIWLMLLSMFLWIPGLMQKKDKEQWVVSINDKKISRNQFDSAVNQEREKINAIKRRFGKFAKELFDNMKLSMNPRKSALDLIVQEELISQEADKLNLRVGQETVMQKLSDSRFLVQEFSNLIPISAFDKSGDVNTAVFFDSLQKRGQWDIFEEMAAVKIKKRMLESIVESALYIPDFEIRNKYISDFLGKNFSILTLNLNKFLEEVKKDKISDEELKRFFEKENLKSKKYWISETRSGEEWIFIPENYGIKISDEKIEDYYNKYKMHRFLDQPIKLKIRRILLPVDNDNKLEDVEKKAKQIKEELKKDSSKFSELAKKYSQDKESAAKGGLLEYFQKGDQDPSLEKAAFRLKKKGDISDIIQTKDGIEIIQLVDRKPRTFKSLDTVKNEIIKILRDQKFNRVFMRSLKNIVDEDEKVALKMLNDLAKEKKAKKEQLMDIKKDKASFLGKKLFRLKKDDIDFFVNKGRGIVIKLTDIKKAFLPKFEEVKDRVKEDYYNHLAVEKLKTTLKNLKKASLTKTFEQLKEESSLELEKTGFIKKDDRIQLQNLITKNIPVDKMFNIEKINSTIDYFDGSKGFLIRLDTVEQFNEKNFEEKKESIANMINIEHRALIFKGFIASLYRKAKIEFDKSFENLIES